MKNANKFREWLLNIKGYSNKTAEVYYKYAKHLENNQRDYIEGMNKYRHTCNNTKRVILSAFKKYYEFIKDKRRNQIILPKKEKRVQDYVRFDEYKELINFVENHKTTNISLIIIRLLFETGIRSSELLNIKTSDVFNNRIRIYGKNRLERFVFVCDSLAKIINDLKIKKIKNNNHKLFSIGYKALYKRISNLSKRINKKLSPHMFRRGFATYCTLQNIGIYQISQMMGHENINTTKNYIKCNPTEELMTSIFK